MLVLIGVLSGVEGVGTEAFFIVSELQVQLVFRGQIEACLPERIIELVVGISTVASTVASGCLKAVLRIAPCLCSTELNSGEAMHTSRSLDIEGGIGTVLGDDVDSSRESACTIDEGRRATQDLYALNVGEVHGEVEAQMPRLTTADIYAIE